MDSVFVGRDIEQERLKELLSEAMNSSLQIAFIAGDQGDGKTALIEYFLTSIQESHPGLSYAIGSCQEITKEKGYKPFQEIFAQLTGVRSQEIQARLGKKQEFDLKHKIQIATKTLAKVAPDIIGVLAPPISLLMKVAIETSDQVISRHIEASKDSSINEDQLKSQCVRFLGDLSKVNPLVLVLDDIQWIDSSSLNLIRYLQENLSNFPVLLIFTYRPDEITSDLTKWRNDVIYKYSAVTLDLRASRQNSRGYDFVGSFLEQNGCDVNDAFKEEFYKRTQAQPLLVVELLNYVIRSKVLIEDPPGVLKEASEKTDWTQIPTRITKIEALIDNRLKLINEELLEVLNVASVEGYEFTAQVIARITGKSERTILEALSHQLDREHGLVREIGEESIGSVIISRFRFSNILYQDHIYTGLGSSVRRVRHLEVAEALEEIHKENLNQVAVFLAKHYDLAKDYRKTSKYLIMLGNQQIENRLTEEAIETLKKALPLAETANYTEGIIDANRFLGMQLVSDHEQHDEAEKHFDTAIKLAKESNDLRALSYSLRGLGRIRRSQEKISEAMDCYMEGLNIAKLAEDLNSQGACINNIGVILSDDEGRYYEAIHFYLQRLEIAQELGNKNGETIALINIGSTLRKMGNYNDARRYLDEAMQIALEREDWFLKCGINIPLAYVETRENYINQAAKLLLDTIALSNEKKYTNRRRESFVGAADLFVHNGNFLITAKILGHMELHPMERKERERIADMLSKADVDNETISSSREEGKALSEDELSAEIITLLTQIANSA